MTFTRKDHQQVAPHIEEHEMKASEATSKSTTSNTPSYTHLTAS